MGKQWIYGLVLIAAWGASVSCMPAGGSKTAEQGPVAVVPQGQEDPNRVEKSEAEWKSILDPQAFYVLRQKGTEQAFTGAYYNHKGTGTYVCAGCENPLFSSEHKFRSGTGWPSFWLPIEDGKIGEISDRSYGMVRTEVVCNRCDGHLGHVFNDGPEPTGLRYCINSVSLQFVPENDKTSKK